MQGSRNGCLPIFLIAETTSFPVTIIFWNRAEKDKPQRDTVILSLLLLPCIGLFSVGSLQIAAVLLRIVVLESRKFLAPISFTGYYSLGLTLRVHYLTNTISRGRNSVFYWCRTPKYSKATLWNMYVFKCRLSGNRLLSNSEIRINSSVVLVRTGLKEECWVCWRSWLAVLNLQLTIICVSTFVAVYLRQKWILEQVKLHFA